jgi:hypothetical protein
MNHPNELALLRGNGTMSAPVVPAELDLDTVNALSGFVGQLEKLARASRPVVLRGPEPDRYSAPAGHPGIDVTIPTPAEPAAAEPAERLPRLFTRAEVFYYCGMTLTGCGSAGFAVAHYAVNGVAALAVFGAFLVLVSGIVLHVQNGRRGGIEIVHGRVKPRGRT